MVALGIVSASPSRLRQRFTVEGLGNACAKNCSLLNTADANLSPNVGRQLHHSDPVDTSKIESEYEPGWVFWSVQFGIVSFAQRFFENRPVDLLAEFDQGMSGIEQSPRSSRC